MPLHDFKMNDLNMFYCCSNIYCMLFNLKAVYYSLLNIAFCYLVTSMWFWWSQVIITILYDRLWIQSYFVVLSEWFLVVQSEHKC